MNRERAKITIPEPPEYLFDEIMGRIQRERQILILKRQLTFFGLVMAVSGVAFIPAIKMLEAEISQSGFLQFLSLIFSDLNSTIFNWQSFILAILESFPIENVVLLLSLSIVFLWSFKFFMRNIKVILTNTNNYQYGFK
jgi:hypothetical protein